jgi:hypothetical protein
MPAGHANSAAPAMFTVADKISFPREKILCSRMHPHSTPVCVSLRVSAAKKIKLLYYFLF